VKKILFGIFAHPDDEAFGPSASLYNAAQNNVDVHLVIATDGEGGTNIDNVPDLGSLRLQEWEESRERIGAKSGLALHYADGGLCNNFYLEVAQKIIDHIFEVCSDYSQELLVEFMTFDHEGVTGHLDHVALSYITTYIYLTLQKSPPPHSKIGSLRYYCLPEVMVSEPEMNWIYMAKGKKPNEIDEVFDFSNMLDIKHYIMEAHYSQRRDMEEIILVHQNLRSKGCRCDHFRYYK
jgi:LmbE family N-acetylglucosaminyl deacetylase